MKSDNGHKVLQGLAGLAAGRGVGCLLLQTEQEVSAGRFVRANEPIASFIRVGCSKYRRRSWKGKFSFICSVSAHFAGFPKRNRDAYHNCRKTIVGQSGRTINSFGNLRRNWQNDQGVDPRYPGQKMNSLFAIRYSLFAPLRSAYV